jgi:hypothetical protein
MGMEEIEETFPLLRRGENCKKASEWDFNYNCLAFVLGDYSNWWEPPGVFGHYWPPGFSQDISVDTVTSIIKLHGFTVEFNPHETPVTESIAIYAKGDDWEHFAKYSGGVWKSKIGEDEDIEHSSPDLLEGEFYGYVVKILSREQE